MVKIIQDRKTRQIIEGTSKVEVRTFGYFTVFADGMPVHFRRKPSKAIFAFLVDGRGQTVSKQIIASEVFNEDRFDERVKNRMHTYLVSLKEDLERQGIGYILYINSNEYGVVTGSFYCDYYDLLEGNLENVKDDPSTYLLEYEWAVGRRTFLENKYYGGL